MSPFIIKIKSSIKNPSERILVYHQQTKTIECNLTIHIHLSAFTNYKVNISLRLNNCVLSFEILFSELQFTFKFSSPINSKVIGNSPLILFRFLVLNYSEERREVCFTVFCISDLFKKLD